MDCGDRPKRLVRKLAQRTVRRSDRRSTAGMRPGGRQLRRTALGVQGSACRATAQCGTKFVGFLLLPPALRRRRFRGTRRNRAGRQHASRYCGTRNRIAERGTESVGQKRPKCLIIGSPTRARTWDLRINSPSGHRPESRASQRSRPKRPVIFSVDSRSFPLGTINSSSRYYRVSLTKFLAPTGAGNCAEMRREICGK